MIEYPLTLSELKQLIPLTNNLPTNKWHNFGEASRILMGDDADPEKAFHALMWLSGRGILEFRAVYRLGPDESELTYQYLKYGREYSFIHCPISGKKLWRIGRHELLWSGEA